MNDHDTERLLHSAPPPSFSPGHEGRLESRLAALEQRPTVLRRPVPLWGALAASLLTGAGLFEIGRLGQKTPAPSSSLPHPPSMTPTLSIPADLFGSRPVTRTDVSLWSMLPAQGDPR